MSKRECEVLVIGAGPAGIAAACCAGEAGRKVMIADENPAPGGQIWRDDGPADAPHPREANQASAWLERLARSGVTMLPGSAAFDADAHLHTVRFEREQGVVEVHYESLVLATGARELFLPFPGWTLPGVCGAGGLQALVKGGLSVTGRRVVVAGTGPLLAAAAGLLGRHGAAVLMVLEQARWSHLARFSLALAAFPDKLVQAARLFADSGGAPFRPGWWVCEAGGGERLEWVKLTNGHRRTTVACDLLACGYGLVANTELAQLLQCRMRGSPPFVEVDEYQQTTVEGVFACGELTGIGGAELSLQEGCVAGRAAAGFRRSARQHIRARERYRRFAEQIEVAFQLRTELKHLARPDTVVCRCEDVPIHELNSYGSWREAKLASRCGMGPCQGRVCSPAVEFVFGWQARGARPPITTVRVESLANVCASRGGV